MLEWKHVVRGRKTQNTELCSAVVGFFWWRLSTDIWWIYKYLCIYICVSVLFLDWFLPFIPFIWYFTGRSIRMIQKNVFIAVALFQCMGEFVSSWCVYLPHFCLCIEMDNKLWAIEMKMYCILNLNFIIWNAYWRTRGIEECILITLLTIISCAMNLWNTPVIMLVITSFLFQFWINVLESISVFKVYRPLTNTKQKAQIQ